MSDLRERADLSLNSNGNADTEVVGPEPEKLAGGTRETDHKANHMWHVWMNRRQDERRKQGIEDWEHHLYEFKSMLEFLEYGHEVIQRAFEGGLRKTHRQCSRQAPVPIENNVLKCCLEAQDITTCPILLSVKSVFDEHAKREPIGTYSYDVPVEHLYRTMAKTCAWHIYQNHRQCDTSEGYLLDTSDRMFWDNVYESMRYACDPDDEESSQEP